MPEKALIIVAVKGRFAYLLGSLIALMLAVPLLSYGRIWSFLISLFASVLLVSCLHAAQPGSRAVKIGLILSLTDFILGRLLFHDGFRWVVALQAFLWLATLIFVTLMLLETVFERDRVDVQTLHAALCIYLIIGLIWVYFYILIELIAPGAFRYNGEPTVAWADEHEKVAVFTRLFLLSFSKLTSAGYHDLEPNNTFANICVCLEVLAGQVFLAVVIARLVGMQIAQGASKDRIDVHRENASMTGEQD